MSLAMAKDSMDFSDLNQDELAYEFEWLTEARRSARLRIAVLDAEIREKEYQCKKERKRVDALDKDYSTLVEIISQRNGD